MALFYLATLVLLIRPKFSARTAAGVLCCGALALGSKEMAATLAGALLLVILPLGDRRARFFTVGGLGVLVVVHAIGWMALFPTKVHFGSTDLFARLPNFMVLVFVPTSCERWWEGGGPSAILAAPSGLGGSPDAGEAPPVSPPGANVPAELPPRQRSGTITAVAGSAGAGWRAAGRMRRGPI